MSKLDDLKKKQELLHDAIIEFSVRTRGNGNTTYLIEAIKDDSICNVIMYNTYQVKEFKKLRSRSNFISADRVFHDNLKTIMWNVPTVIDISAVTKLLSKTYQVSNDLVLELDKDNNRLSEELKEAIKANNEALELIDKLIIESRKSDEREEIAEDGLETVKWRYRWYLALVSSVALTLLAFILIKS